MAVMPMGSMGTCPEGTWRVTPMRTVIMAQATRAGMPACSVAIQRNSRTRLRHRCIATTESSSTASTMPFTGQAIMPQRTGPATTCSSMPAPAKPQQT